MTQPQGRVLAVQQQMFFATILNELWGIDEKVILNKLALAGLKLVPDTDEVAVDAASILPKLTGEPMTKPKLQAVSNKEDK